MNDVTTPFTVANMAMNLPLQTNTGKFQLSTSSGAMVYDTDCDTESYYTPNSTLGNTMLWRQSSYTLLNKILLSTNTGTVGFTGIPQTFNHLKLWMNLRTSSSTSASINIQLANPGQGVDTGANYSAFRFALSSTTIPSTSLNGLTGIYGGVQPTTSSSSGTSGPCAIDFPFYTNTYFNRYAFTLSNSESNVSVGSAQYTSSTWNNTGSIGAIRVLSSDAGSLFQQGCTFYLYGMY